MNEGPGSLPPPQTKAETHSGNVVRGPQSPPSHCEIHPQTLRLSVIGFGNIRHANKLIEIEETRGGGGKSAGNRGGEQGEKEEGVREQQGRGAALRLASELKGRDVMDAK